MDKFVLGVLVGGAFTVWLIIAIKSTYRDGQIDALQGKVKYELVLQPNGERLWETKKTP